MKTRTQIRPLLASAKVPDYSPRLHAGGWLTEEIAPTRGRVPPIDPVEPPTTSERVLVVVTVEPESDLVTSYWLASPDGDALPVPIAGQFLPVAVDVPGHGVLRRNYTISAHEAGRYRLSIKRERLRGQAPGRVSNHIHDQWAVGDRISVGTPQGHFVLDSTDVRPTVLLAGGIGITPLLAMLRNLAARQSTRKVVLIMAARHHRDHPFRNELASFASRLPNFSVHVRYSEQVAGIPEGQAPDSFGFVDEALLRDLVPTPDADIYICGPGPFMNAVDHALVALGVPDRHVRFEAFGPATIERHRKPAAAAVSAPASTVNFAKSGITAPFDPRTLNLLEFAEDLGLSPPFICRSGSCGTCATRKLSGAIRYVEEPTAVVEDDQVLICCAQPVGPVSLDL